MARLQSTIITGSLQVTTFITASQYISASSANFTGNVTASLYYGDGRYLTNVTASAAGNLSVAKLTATSVSASGDISGSVHYGSGAGLTSLNGSNISTGTVAQGRGGFGTDVSGFVDGFIIKNAGSCSVMSTPGLIYVDDATGDPMSFGGSGNYVVKMNGSNVPSSTIIQDSGATVSISGSLDNAYVLKVYGDLGVTGTIYETSTIKIKENVQSLTDEVTKIMQIRPVEFDYIETGIHSVGFIAEELNEIYPDAVMRNDEGEPIGVAYADMVSPLTRALQQVVEKLNDLTARVEALEKNANNG